MHWIYLIHKFHNLSWITEINELFHDIQIYWDAPVYTCKYFQNIGMYVYLYILHNKYMQYTHIYYVNKNNWNEFMIKTGTDICQWSMKTSYFMSFCFSSKCILIWKSRQIYWRASLVCNVIRGYSFHFCILKQSGFKQFKHKQYCRRQRWYPVLVSFTCSLPYVTLFLDYLLVWLFWVHPRLLASPRVCACDTFCGLCFVFSKMNEKVLMYCKLYFHILKHC